MFFSQGNGRRQVQGTPRYKPEFIAWMPHKTELIDKRQPLTSVYRENFHSGTGKVTPSPYKQLYANQIANQVTNTRRKVDVHKNQGVFNEEYPSDNKNHFTTTYRRIHCTTDPRQAEAKEINTICYQSANQQMIERARSVGPSSRESVASCLSWSVKRSQTAGTSTTCSFYFI